MKTPKALVVAYDEKTRLGVDDILGALGHPYDYADSLTEARKFLAANGYTYVLLDHELPAHVGGSHRMQNAENFLDELAATKGNHRPPVIVLCNPMPDMDEEDKLRWAADMRVRGATTFVIKPFRSAGRTLDRVIKKVLAGKTGWAKIMWPEPASTPSAKDEPGDEKWLTVTQAAELLVHDLSGLGIRKARSRISTAAGRGEFKTIGSRRDRRIDPVSHLSCGYRQIAVDARRRFSKLSDNRRRFSALTRGQWGRRERREDGPAVSARCEEMVQFKNKILMVGYGAVAKCTLPILVKQIDVPMSSITVLDFEDKADELKSWIAKGVKYVHDRITPGNLGAMLGEHLGVGDLLIDLAWNIDCCELLEWCHKHGVLYVNTSVELWNPYAGAKDKHPAERTLYHRHMKVRGLVQAWKKQGPTAVLEHGANPGLISHFTKQGLIDIAERLLADGKVKGEAAKEIAGLAARGVFNELAMKLGVKVIHVSERDTQISNTPKQVNEFVNTWSIEGFREEGITTSEMGWGTHEKQLPPHAYQHADDGPRNQICLAQMGMNTWVRSWVPDYCIRGMVVRHGEAFTISDRLTVWDGDKAVYRPTVHYAYCPCDAAIASLNELRGCDYKLQPNLRILHDEIVSGSDILGALLMGHAYNSWWTGSDLSIEESRKLVPHQNATTMQVAISVVSAVAWMIGNPARGVLVPDDLPHDEILALARPYLGRCISKASDWTPLKNYANHFEGFNTPDLDTADPWQFKNFLVTDRE